MPVCTHLSQAILRNEQVMFAQDTVFTPHLKWPPHRAGLRSPMLQMRNCSSGKLRNWYRVRTRQSSPARITWLLRRLFPVKQKASTSPSRPPVATQLLPRAVSAAHSARPVPGSSPEELHGRSSPRRGSTKAQPQGRLPPLLARTGKLWGTALWRGRWRSESWLTTYQLSDITQVI